MKKLDPETIMRRAAYKAAKRIQELDPKVTEDELIQDLQSTIKDVWPTIASGLALGLRKIT